MIHLTVLDIADHEALVAGKWGMFDDNGVYPGCLIPHEGALRSHYMAEGYLLTIWRWDWRKVGMAG